MQIVLVCLNGSGSAAFPASTIEGLPVPARKYPVIGYRVVLEGFADAVLHSDADELLAMPGELFRLPTPAEQEAMAKATEQASMVQEDAPAPPALEEVMSTESESKKAQKASSGG